MMTILRTENLTINIEHKKILQDINVVIPTGKRTAIIGPNGSGKSTLLKTLAGLLKPSAGKVWFEQAELDSYSKNKLAQQLAILPQGSAVPADLTVMQLVDYGRFPHRSWWSGDYAADRQATAWALEQTGLTALQERLVSTLSGGERQRAWIAMALAQQPKILLLDEPTTYLDIAHQLEVMQIIAELNRNQKISVVMVLHDLNHALQYADEIIVIKEGLVFANGAPKEVLTLNLLKQVFGVTADFFSNSQGQSVLMPLERIIEKIS